MAFISQPFEQTASLLTWKILQEGVTSMSAIIRQMKTFFLGGGWLC
jgi:hypothetical protein